MKNNFIVLTFVLMANYGFAQSTLYVAPNGATGNPGTLASPTTLERAITLVTAGGTIYMRGGTYTYSSTILIARGNDGSAGSTKKIFAYNGEVPVLSFSGQTVSTSNRGIVLDALYWHLKDLIIERAGDNGILLSGNNNTIENCVFRGNNDTGLQLSRYNTSYTSISQWPANNLILNCEAYDNKDPDNEDADGFAAKLTSGTGNIFRNCVSHHNIDDGWDLYTKADTGPIGPITLENCIAHSNGTLTTGGTSGNGDKNGFKLGGEDIAVNHIVRRCVAFNNGQHGFTYNRNLGSIEVTNNTAYNNAERNYNFDGGTSTFKNNLSYFSGTGTNDRIIGTQSGSTNAFWSNNATTNFTVNSADFVSLTPGANKTPTANGFLNLASGSDLINAGATSSGITYTGSAPDIGAIESGGTTTPTYTLGVNINPSGGGSVTRSPNASSYNAGTVVTLTATPASGYVFSGWSGGASGTSSTTTITMNANQTVTANFTTSSGYTLTVNVNPSSGGSVTKNPNASSYSAGTAVTLTATPASGYVFSGWSGGASGTSSTTTITMNANQTVTASFTASGSGSAIRLEDAASPSSGYCSADGSRQNSYSGASNGYYINLSNSAAKGINWNVSAPSVGNYTLTWRYANAGSASATTGRVLVNGATAVASVAFPKTTAWTTWTTATTTVALNAGVNTIRLETIVAAEFANIDWLEITGNSPAAASCSGTSSVNSARMVQPEELPLGNSAGFTVYPNPAAQRVNLNFELSQPGHVNLTVYDALGRSEMKTGNVWYEAGAHEMSVDVSHFKGGAYLFAMQSGKQYFKQRVIVK